ncbi:hypothetical protein PPYR_15388 [Photinus pyralis]|uniref:DDE Tnp4 domain-containing protein n=1 Tax=Photinus pyralis TaxID=7054 RepID=A0A5N3ZYZ0_PHOPY|nr:hypothetical protein PPYR_15388 [Photinus pyralis]
MDRTIVLRCAAAAVICTLTLVIVNRRRRQRIMKKKRRIWAKKWLQRHNQGRGMLNMLNEELLTEDPSCYCNFLRLNNKLFEKLLSEINQKISKQDTFMRDSISARSRLEITLRFLATGETYRSLMYATRIHERALDGRHIKFRPPQSAGSFYFNYKGDHSIVLLGLSDACYKFTYVNVGVNGRVSDGGLLRESKLWEALLKNALHFPPSSPLPGRSTSIPYVIIADDAFPLMTHIMKPYSQRGLSYDCKIYNYRLSRARRMIESTFGILANRFRVLLNPINLSPEKVEVITLCCVVLHNLLVTENRVAYCDILADAQNMDTLLHIAGHHGNRNSSNARSIRDELKDFFNTTGAREWQHEQVNR